MKLSLNIKNGVRIMFRSLVFIISIFWLSVIQGMESPDESCISALLTEKANVQNRLWAVHVTEELPKDGVIVPGYNNQDSVRPTVHFSIGHLVNSHFWGDWDDAKVAILTPLSSLKPQLVNIFTEDSYIVGAFDIPPEAIVLVQGELMVPDDIKARIVRYREGASLENEVDKVLKGINALQFKRGVDFDTGMVTVMVDGEDFSIIEEERFWKQKGYLLGGVHFQLHSESDFHLLEEISEYIDPIRLGRPQNIFLSDLEKDIKRFRQARLSVLNQVSNLSLTELSNKVWLKKLKLFDEQLNLLEVEILLKNEYDKTWRPVLDKLGDKIYRAKDSKERLLELIKENLDIFPSI